MWIRTGSGGVTGDSRDVERDDWIGWGVGRTLGGEAKPHLEFQLGLEAREGNLIGPVADGLAHNHINHSQHLGQGQPP